ncbi:hypothetical protein Raf01_42850 [Rugosimonospora africana]|uniref:Uncharacterized protein n=2 Tax=Rugosimonospora africana TaxID=556532 RepID=A0A8J3QSM7_9ACTN|nr:hypothetical protein Raf01_42850 [Rugosimonospora africana]
MTGMSIRRQWRGIASGMLAVAVLLGGWAGVRWWRDKPPYGPEAVAAHAIVQMVGNDSVWPVLTGWGVRRESFNVPYLDPGWQLVAGQVRYTMPRSARNAGQYWILVEDMRSRYLARSIWGTGPDPGKVWQGWDGAVSAGVSGYPWLSDYRSTDSGGVSVPTDAPGPVEFVAMIPPSIGPIAVSDLTVSLVFLGKNRHVYWAQRLLG